MKEVFYKFPEGDELESALREWARKRFPRWTFDLNQVPRPEYAWVLGAARFLYDISRTPKTKELRDFGFDRSTPAYGIPPFHVPAWVPNEELDDYRERVIKEFREFLTNWIEECKDSRSRLMLDRGARPRHYKWAAEWVCLERSFGKIALDYGLETRVRHGVKRQTVHQAVDKVLIELGVKSVNLKSQKTARQA